MPPGSFNCVGASRSDQGSHSLVGRRCDATPRCVHAAWLCQEPDCTLAWWIEGHRCGILNCQLTILDDVGVSGRMRHQVFLPVRLFEEEEYYFLMKTDSGCHKRTNIKYGHDECIPFTIKPYGPFVCLFVCCYKTRKTKLLSQHRRRSMIFRVL